MSLPPPWMVQVPPERVCPPALGATVPISAQLHALGQTPGGTGSPAATAAPSRGAGAGGACLCEVMAKPAWSAPVMPSTVVEPGIAVQVVPSGEVYAV